MGEGERRRLFLIIRETKGEALRSFLEITGRLGSRAVRTRSFLSSVLVG